MHLHSESFVFNCKKAKGSVVRLSLVRYSTAESITYTNGVILFCIHGIGGFKEEWRPILDPLFQKNDVNVSEAWCLDLYSHGESLTYNKELVMSNIETSDLDLCWRHLVDILESGLIQRGNRKLVMVGNSIGDHPILGCARDCVQRGVEIPFSSVIFFAPVFLPGEIVIKATGRMRKLLASRKWQWDSRDEAEKYVKTNHPAKSWDPEMQKVLIDYGMIHTFQGTQLKNPAFVAAQCYPRADLPLTKEANPTAVTAHESWAYLPEFCKHMTTHFVCGDVHDFVPEVLENEMLERVKGRLASVQRVHGAGHMICHEKPRECAEAIRTILQQVYIPAKL